MSEFEQEQLKRFALDSAIFAILKGQVEQVPKNSVLFDSQYEEINLLRTFKPDGTEYSFPHGAMVNMDLMLVKMDAQDPAIKKLIKVDPNTHAALKKFVAERADMDEQSYYNVISAYNRQEILRIDDPAFSPPPHTYIAVMDKEAYRQLARRFLSTLAEPQECQGIFDIGQHDKEGYKKGFSRIATVVDRVLRLADLPNKEIEALEDKIREKWRENYEFLGALTKYRKAKEAGFEAKSEVGTGVAGSGGQTVV